MLFSDHNAFGQLVPEKMRSVGFCVFPESGEELDTEAEMERQRQIEINLAKIAEAKRAQVCAVMKMQGGQC